MIRTIISMREKIATPERSVSSVRALINVPRLVIEKKATSPKTMELNNLDRTAAQKSSRK